MALCTNCGADNPDRAKFCLECGTTMPAAETRSSGARKLVTILFADVVGSTALGEQLDPETMRAALSRYFSTARTVLERHGGTVEKFIGDAVMAVFGIPLLHEDDALRAVRAAVELRDEIARLNERLSAERGLRVEFRIGVNSGMVVAGGGDGSGSFVTGDAVNVAARIEQAAGAGDVLIGDATFRLVRDQVVTQEHAPIAAKGKAEEVSAHLLIGMVGGVEAAVRASEHQASFVGRRRELSRLGESFDDAVAERRCFLFTLLGSAGVGKSRLVSEFINARTADAAVVRGRCLPYGEGITYWAVGEIVRAAIGVADDATAEVIRDRVLAAIRSDASADRLAEVLLSALGLSTVNATPEERGWAVRRFLEAHARERPLVCLVEDIHWAEPALLDMLENIADLTRDAPILLLCTARPELLEARSTWGGGKTNATTILLEPLNADATRELVAGLLAGAQLAPQLAERILATSEGNPLFAEEIVRMLADSGEGALLDDQVPIPTSIQAVIAARLDRLPAQERVVAERAAVAGRVFERSAVLELVREHDRERVPDALLALMRKELVQPSAPDLTADEAFRFRHMLIRDTAYEGLPKQDRADLHERFAGWVERVAADRIDEYAEIVGYHLELAVRYRRELGLEDEHLQELALRAGDRLAGAGYKAYLRGEDAAVKLLKRAVALLPPGPGRRHALINLSRSSLGVDWQSGVWASKELEEDARTTGNEADLKRAQMLTILARAFSDPTFVLSTAENDALEAARYFEQVGDNFGVAIAQDVLATIYLGLANWDRSRAAAERGLPFAIAAGDPVKADGMRFYLVNAALWGTTPVGELIEIADEQIAAVSSRIAVAMMKSARGLGLAWAGEAAPARANVEEALAIRRELGDPAHGWQFTAPVVEMTLGDLDAAMALVKHNIAMLKLAGETGQRSTQEGFRARIAFDMGQPDAEVIEAAEQCRELAQSDDTVSQLQWRSALALVAARAGRHAEARALMDEAMDLLTASGTDFLIEHGLVALDNGYVHAQAGEKDKARESYQRALELFEQKGDVMDAARVRERLAAL